MHDQRPFSATQSVATGRATPQKAWHSHVALLEHDARQASPNRLDLLGGRPPSRILVQPTDQPVRVRGAQYRRWGWSSNIFAVYWLTGPCACRPQQALRRPLAGHPRGAVQLDAALVGAARFREEGRQGRLLPHGAATRSRGALGEYRFVPKPFSSGPMGMRKSSKLPIRACSIR